MKRVIILAFSMLIFVSSYTQRWSVDKANRWYKSNAWLVGANYVPASAINQLEMWQAETFDLKMIDKELAWAEKLGFNTMRVFLHHLLWEENSVAFLRRVDLFLDVCQKHGIKPMLVLLDDVWDPHPRLGKQKEPLKGIHNSGWVQSPGREVLIDENRHYELKPYIQGVLKHFKDDKRVLIWDLYNEPGNMNGSSYIKFEPKNKAKYSLSLLKKVFAWAREINPSQPICADNWKSQPVGKMDAIDRFAYENSDVINFHCYSDKENTLALVKSFAQSGRPLICTEYMARKTGSTFQNILPIFKKYHVAAYNWGFVDGKSQTIYPWNTWGNPLDNEPKLWFHDIFRKDGTPYIKEETEFIQKLLIYKQ
jgi:hypothetical protein